MADHSIITELEEYAARRGISPGSICGYVFGQYRRFEHLQNRLRRLEEDEAKLRAYMAENPPQEPPCAGAA